MSIPLFPMARIRGMRVATKGMLSRKAEMRAENHRMMTSVRARLPWVADMSQSARSWITPVSCKPPTTTNRPVKKRMVVHSTPATVSSRSCRPMSSMMAAAVRAMVQDSRCSWA